MKRRCLFGFCISVLFLWLLPCAASGASRDDVYKQYIHCSSAQLYDISIRQMADGHTPSDTALVCLTIIYNRYSPSLSREEQIRTVKACLKLWTIYFYTYYDYPKCFEYLVKARDIAKQVGFEEPTIFLNLGAMYQTISEETGNSKLNQKAFNYYCQAFEVAYRNADHLHADMAMTNALYVGHLLSVLPKTRPLMLKYKRMGHKGMLRSYNLMLFDALMCLEKNNRKAAIGIFDKQIRLLGDTKEYLRLVYFTYINKVRALRELGQVDEALEQMKRPKAIAEQMNQKDLKLEVYTVLSELYRLQGDKGRYGLYRDHYYQLKDTLTNYRQLASVSELEFQSQLKEVSDEMRELAHRHETQRLVSMVVGLVSVVILILLFVVYRQNRRLRQNNEQLYRQNVSLLEADEERRKMRKMVKQGSLNTPKPDEKDEKTRQSLISDAEGQALLDRILTVMEGNDEVFQSGFSVERLASLTDSKYKYVSQVIHEKLGCNFNTLLNDYRIKEACKRMNDAERYGNYTIEAISASVGFRSRSTFVTSFKRITGLTPSEYQALARRASAPTHAD